MRMRTGGCGLLPGARRWHRVSAGSDPGRRALDFSQGERGTGADPCPGGGAGGFRGSGSPWTDRRSFLRPICPPQEGGASPNRSRKKTAVNAHLCEVLRLSPPQEVQARSNLVFRRRRRGGGCGRDARTMTGPSSPAWWTGPWRAFSDCAAEAASLRKVDRRSMQRTIDRDGIRCRKTRCRKCSSILRKLMDRPRKLRSCRTFAASLTGCGDHRAYVDAHGHEVLRGEVLQFESARAKKAKALGPARTEGLKLTSSRVFHCRSSACSTPLGSYSLFFGRS